MRRLQCAAQPCRARRCPARLWHLARSGRGGACMGCLRHHARGDAAVPARAARRLAIQGAECAAGGRRVAGSHAAAAAAGACGVAPRHAAGRAAVRGPGATARIWWWASQQHLAQQSSLHGQLANVLQHLLSMEPPSPPCYARPLLSLLQALPLAVQGPVVHKGAGRLVAWHAHDTVRTHAAVCFSITHPTAQAVAGPPAARVCSDATARAATVSRGPAGVPF